MANTLQLRSQGDEVRRLQEFLTSKGIDVGAIDGKFGPLTRMGVRAFQRSQGLADDGVVGRNTWGAIETSPAWAEASGQAAPAAGVPVPPRRPDPNAPPPSGEYPDDGGNQNRQPQPAAAPPAPSPSPDLAQMLSASGNGEGTYVPPTAMQPRPANPAPPAPRPPEGNGEGAFVPPASMQPRPQHASLTTLPNGIPKADASALADPTREMNRAGTMTPPDMAASPIPSGASPTLQEMLMSTPPAPSSAMYDPMTMMPPGSGAVTPAQFTLPEAYGPSEAGRISFNDIMTVLSGGTPSGVAPPPPGVAPANTDWLNGGGALPAASGGVVPTPAAPVAAGPEVPPEMMTPEQRAARVRQIMEAAYASGMPRPAGAP